MTAMVYRTAGGPEVIQPEKLPVPEPGPGEVLVKIAISGVNPTDWKTRSSSVGRGGGQDWQIPNQDGAGRIVSVGEGVDPSRVGERVWLYLAADGRPWGTAAEYSVVPAGHAVTLGPGMSYELGADLGVPFLTAHRCLTIGEPAAGQPNRLSPGVLSGRTVLVQGGAGAVGNATIQLANWAGATVIATVSSPRKAELAQQAGSTYVFDYTQQDVVAEVRGVAPEGVDLIVEVAPSANAEQDVAVLARHGAVAIYGGSPDETFSLPVRSQMALNARWQFVLLYTVPVAGLAAGVMDLRAAMAAGAIRVGDEVGLPLHRFPLSETAAAHQAVQDAAVGKVLIEVDENLD